MTDNQFNQLFNLVTNCIGGINELRASNIVINENISNINRQLSTINEELSTVKEEVSTIKGDVSELKHGQIRIEKELVTMNKTIDSLAGESFRTRSRLDILEQIAN